MVVDASDFFSGLLTKDVQRDVKSCKRSCKEAEIGLHNSNSGNFPLDSSDWKLSSGKQLGLPTKVKEDLLFQSQSHAIQMLIICFHLLIKPNIYEHNFQKM